MPRGSCLWHTVMAAGAIRLLVAMVAALPLQAGALADAAAASDSAFPFVEIAAGAHVHLGHQEEADAANRGDIANIGFVVGRDAVAVIDTGGSPAVGRALRAAVRAVTPLPIRYVVNTHVHPDHIFGNAAFAADHPVFVGHAALPLALARRGAFYREALGRTLGEDAAGAEVIGPGLLVTDRLDVDLGGRTLTVRAHPTAHTDNDLTVFDSATGTLWASDLLFVERVPVVDGSVLGWLSELDRLGAMPVARVVPGHGAVSTDWPGVLAPQRRYLSTLVGEVRRLIKDGGTIEQAVATVGRGEAGNWLLFEAYHRRNVTAVFVELEWE